MVVHSKCSRAYGGLLDFFLLLSSDSFRKMLGMSVYRYLRSFSNVGLYLKEAKKTSLAQRKTEVICERKRKREKSFSFLVEGSKLNATHVHGLMGFLVLYWHLHLHGYRLLHHFMPLGSSKELSLIGNMWSCFLPLVPSAAHLHYYTTKIGCLGFSLPSFP